MRTFIWKAGRPMAGLVLILAAANTLQAGDSPAPAGRTRIRDFGSQITQTNYSTGGTAAQPTTATSAATDVVAEPAPIVGGYEGYGDCGPFGGGYGPGFSITGAGRVHYRTFGMPPRGYTSFHTTPRQCTGPLDCWLGCHQTAYRARNAQQSAALGAYLRCSLAWLRPLTYWDVGRQCDNIALDPGYAHPADVGGVYAAQGYGVPLSVPLAPVVLDQYNYSWGVPASRLTPVGVPPGP